MTGGKPAARRPFASLPPATQAGIMCNDESFQRFVADRCGHPSGRATQTAATEFLRRWCKVASRKDLAHNRPAQDRLETLRSAFDVWAGKLAPPQ